MKYKNETQAQLFSVELNSAKIFADLLKTMVQDDGQRISGFRDIVLERVKTANLKSIKARIRSDLELTFEFVSDGAVRDFEILQ